eukprot:9993844-Lingulodinium_polyedra.AAC.1
MPRAVAAMSWGHKRRSTPWRTNGLQRGKGAPAPRQGPPAARKRPTPRQTGREGQASDRRASAALLK